MSETVIWIAAKSGRPADKPRSTPIEWQEVSLLSLSEHLGGDRRASGEAFGDDYSVSKPDFHNDAPSNAKLFIKVVATARFADGLANVAEKVQAWVGDEALYGATKALVVHSGEQNLEIEVGAADAGDKIKGLA